MRGDRRGQRRWLAGLLVGVAAVQGGGGLVSQTPAPALGETPVQTPVRPSMAPEPPQVPAGAEPPAESSQEPVGEPVRHGQVLFQSHGEPPKPGSNGVMLPSARGQEAAQDAVPDLSDQERTAFTVTRYDLDLRLQPRAAGLAMRARLTVRNDGTEALRRVPLQVSSSLRWEAANEVGVDGVGRVPGAALHPGTTPQLRLVQHTIDSDVDHTGKVTEAILTLGEPLAVGASVNLDVLYSGTLARSTGRLRRIGTTDEQAAGVDWDGVVSGSNGQGTALRGFGNVLWYPVVSPQLFLGSGNELFRAVGTMRQREEATAVKLRVATEYAGDPPAGVYFCGRRQDFKALPDATDAPVASGTGVAVAEFGEAPLGFRTMSLFVVERPETLTAPLPTEADSVTATAVFSASAPGSAIVAAGAQTGRKAGVTAPEPALRKPAPATSEPMLAVETRDDGALPALAASARKVAPLLMTWFGPRPLSALTVLDAAGQPFQDGPLLRASVSTLGTSPAAAVLAHSLTAAWVQTGRPWMDEGLAQFMELLWVEQTAGRPAALAQLAESMTAVDLAEPAFSRTDTRSDTVQETAKTAAGESSSAAALEEAPGAQGGEPLISARNELFYRRKAAAVWWMLRDIAGEDALRQALSAWRVQPASSSAETGHDARAEAVAFQHLLERTSGKDLAWFFDDWVLRDRGLPDLTLVDVTPRQLPAGPGHDSGWLVAVTVRNDGAAVADVPLVVRSGSFSSTRRLRVPGFGSATERVLVEAPPTEVLVNDGSVPEVRVTSHSRTISVRGS